MNAVCIEKCTMAFTYDKLDSNGTFILYALVN